MVSFSVVIVTHGHEDVLTKCLNSLNPAGVEWQLILFANGKDLSEDILNKASSLTPHFTHLQTDIKHTPGKARNLALESAEGEWIFLLDESSFVLSGYWELIQSLIFDPKIDVLGGPEVPAVGLNSLSLSYSMALSSPFCSGSTFVRHKSSGKKLQHADEGKLTIHNLWLRKSAVEGVTFPEDYPAAEEILYLQKIEKLGKGIFYHPKLRVAHLRQTTLSEIRRTSFSSGFYRAKSMKAKIVKVKDFFWVPPFFVLLHFTLFLEPVVFWYLVRMYAGIILFVSMGLALKVKRFYLFPLIAFLHYFILFTYGLGFMWQRLNKQKQNVDRI